MAQYAGPGYGGERAPAEISQMDTRSKYKCPICWHQEKWQAGNVFYCPKCNTKMVEFAVATQKQEKPKRG